MTPYDIDVIEEWREGFKKKRDVFGVQPDIWERVEFLKSKGYTHFPHVQAVLGRRAGKGFIGGVLGAERIAYLHSLDSWQGHFSLKAGTEGWLQVFATSQQQAQRTQFADIRYLVEQCKYLQPWISTSKEGYFSIRTPADLRRIAELESKKVRVEREIASLKAIALSSSSATGRGLSSFCLDPETPVLTADLRWVPIKSVQAGDALVGLDENPEPGKHRKLRKTIVEGKRFTTGKAYRLTFDDGSSVVCSGNHRWLTRARSGSRNFKWQKVIGPSPLHSMQVGTQIFQLVKPWEEDDSREAGYLAGAFDGEGHVYSGSGMGVVFSQNPGAMLDRVLGLLKEKGFQPQKQGKGAYLSQVEGYKCQQWSVRGVAESLRLLGQVRPERLLHKESYEGVSVRGKGSSIYEQPEHIRTVTAIEELEEQTLVDLQTSTRTFIANGLGSHNSIFLDEFAHMVFGSGSTKSGEEIYEAAMPSLDQFGTDRLVYIPSSPFCLEPKTKVLTEDLRWVPIGSLLVGDKLIGFDEYAPGGKGKGRTWQPATVTETSVMRAPRYKITMESGKELISTSEHMWLARRSQFDYEWFKTSKLKPGDKIKSLGVEPWEVDDSREAGYLQGFFDGEGCLSGRANIAQSLGFSQNRGPVLDYVNELLVKRDFDIKDQNPDDKCSKARIMGGMPEMMRFLGQIRPLRLLPKFHEMFYGTRIYGTANPAVDIVTSVEYLDEGEVVVLGTSTNTLVAEGLLSHNSKIGKFFELYQNGRVLMKTEKPDGSSGLTLVDAKMLGLTEDDIEEGLDEAIAEPEMLIFQGPSWIAYEDWERSKSLGMPKFKRAVQVYDERMQRLEQRNPEKFKVERRGQFADVQGAYLDPEKVDAMFEPPSWRAPLHPQSNGVPMHIYRIHCDPGRCLVGDTYINTNQGMVKIVQVEVGDEVVTRDGTDSVVEWVPNGIKDVYRLTLRGGWEIRATGNHPVWTERGWVPLQELRSDDKVQVRVGANLWPQNYVEIPDVRMPKRCNGRICFPVNIVDEKMGRLFGYIAAEGSIQETMLTITSHVDEKLVDEVASLIRDLFGIDPSWERVKGNARTAGWGNNHLMLILQALGFPLNEHCRQKAIPWSILQSPKSVVAQFISAYFSGDGCVSAQHHKDRSVTVSSASGELIKQLQILLGNFGIHSGQYSGWRATGRAGSAKTEYWKLSIRGRSLERFRDQIGFLPDFHEKVMRLDYLADLPHAADPSEFHAVKSLVADGREPTYDLSMQSDHHNFLANGVVCHNTNANFALAVGHLEDAPKDEFGEVWPHVIFDYLKVWQPKNFPDHTIDYLQVQNEIADVLRRFPSTQKISFDMWNSAGPISILRQEFSPKIRIVEEAFSEGANQKRAELFKSALNLGWIHCLAGETRVLTPEGPRPIKELAGGTHKIMTTGQADGRGGGTWVDAPISSFGVQPLMQITLRRNGVDKVIYATDQHRWFVRRKQGTANYRDEVLTKDLKPGQKLSYCYAQRHKETRPSPIGIAHGFTFGDGTRSRKGSVAQFCGDKDKALIPYFDLHPIVDTAPGIRRALDLPKFFKDRVDLAESPSYLYGWLAGYFAADGHVTKDGRAEIDSNHWEDLEHVRAVCNLLGIHTTSIRTKPSYGHGYTDADGYAVNLDRGDLTEDFFLIEEHRNRWKDNEIRPVQDYRGYTVVSVENSDRVEEVFCAEVSGTHSFVLEDNILTGNCYKDDFGEQGTCLLEQEMKFLTEVNGKVKKQDFGPVTTKDLWDCVAVVSTTLLHDALDSWMKKLGLQGAFGSTDISGLRHGREFDRLSQAGVGYRGDSRMRQRLELNSLDRLRGRTEKPRPYLTRGGRWK